MAEHRFRGKGLAGTLLAYFWPDGCHRVVRPIHEGESIPSILLKEGNYLNRTGGQMLPVTSGLPGGNAAMELLDRSTVPQTVSSTKLWALEEQVKTAAQSDSQFETAFVHDPLGATRARFGADALPNEGEFLRLTADGGFDLVFPVTKTFWHFQKQDGDELSDELLSHVSGGGSTTGPGNPRDNPIGTKP